jgi:hypothetical protein
MQAVAITAEAAPTQAEAPRWILSPGRDFALFLGVTLTTLLPWLATERLNLPGKWVLVAVALFNGPHLISTWTRVYLPRSERFARPIHYWVVPALAMAFSIVCYGAGEPGPTIARSIIFYWASWHFVAQSWGVMRIYQRKHDAPEPLVRLEKALIFLPAFFFVARRVYTGPWQLFGASIYHPTLPAWVPNGLGALCVTLAAVYLVRFARSYRGAGVGAPSLARPMYLGFNAIGFAVPFLYIKNGTSAFSAAALWHAVQYLAIVWYFNRQRWKKGVDDDARWLSWASQPGRWPAYIGLLALGAAAVYSVVLVLSLFAWSFERWALALWTGMTFGHYFLDGVIWKFQRYKLADRLVRA